MFCFIGIVWSHLLSKFRSPIIALYGNMSPWQQTEGRWIKWRYLPLLCPYY